MSGRVRPTPRTVLALLIVVAVVIRVLAMTQHPDTYPDAFFQYLEPAWWHVHGYGYPTWEWAVGFRSWIPAAYYGVWMELWRFVGVTDSGFLAWFFGTLGCALGAVVVAAVHDIGKGFLDERAGLIGAALAATSPVLAYYSPQTIIEPLAMVPALLGLALVYGKPSTLADDTPSQDGSRHWRVAGALLGLAGMLRLPFAVVGAFVALDLLVGRRWRPLANLVAASLVPIAVFGLVDWVTWGKPFHSTVQFIEYHSKGRGREHGAVELFDFYPKLLWERAWPALGVVAVAMVAAIRTTWNASMRLLALAALAVVPQMLQPQKLERFVLLFWPLFFVLAGVALSGMWTRLITGVDKRWAGGLKAAFCVLIGVCALVGVRSLREGPKYDYSELWGLFEGQTEVGRRPDATGLLFESRPHLTGGYFRLGRNIPFAAYSPTLLKNHIFNYVIVRAGSVTEVNLLRTDFSKLSQHGGFAVWHRGQPSIPPRQLIER